MRKPLSAEDQHRFSEAIQTLALNPRMARANELLRDGKLDEAMRVAEEAMDDLKRLMTIYASAPDKGE